MTSLSLSHTFSFNKILIMFLSLAKIILTFWLFSALDAATIFCPKSWKQKELLPSFLLPSLQSGIFMRNFLYLSPILCIILSSLFSSSFCLCYISSKSRCAVVHWLIRPSLKIFFRGVDVINKLWCSLTTLHWNKGFILVVVRLVTSFNQSECFFCVV